MSRPAGAITRVHPHSAVLETPFHARAEVLSRAHDWGRWAGYIAANRFTEVELEYFAIRNAATVFDMSPMLKYRVTGSDASAYLNRLLTRNVDRLRPGRVAYCVWCDDRGHVLDDGTLFRYAENEFWLFSQERHLPWLLDSAIGYDVEVVDASDDVAALALQGPTACSVLRDLGLDGIENLRPFEIRAYPFEGGDLTVSRTGFTGDLGYELQVAPARALTLWDRLFDAGRLHGIVPVGSQALDLVRIEAGFIATNVEFMAAEQALRSTRGRSPFELGLGWLVDFDKGHFNGRRALLVERERGSRYCLVGLEIDSNKPALDALVYHRKRKLVGEITSAMWSPTTKRNLALASLRLPHGEGVRDNLWVDIYVRKELKWSRTMARASVVKRPFFDHPRRRAVPAGRY